jgi:hypothetical protein
MAVASSVAGCKSEPTREEVIAKHRTALEAKLTAVQTAIATMSAAQSPGDGYKLSAAPVFLHYPSKSNPADPSANALWAYEADLIEGKPSDTVGERLRIPYTDILLECGEALRGKSSSHPTYLEPILADCARAQFLFAIRVVDLELPSTNIDGKTFSPGHLDTVILVVDLAHPGELAGSFSLRVESSDTAFRQHDSRGPEGALMSKFASAVEYEATQRRKS